MPKNILIIDDIDTARREIRNYINPSASAQDMVAQLIDKGAMARRQRHHIDEACQGEEGVQRARAAFDAGTPYDIIVVDMIMPPGIDGCETIRRIRTFDTNVFIIICTGFGMVADDKVIEANLGQPPLTFYKPEISGLTQVIGRLTRDVGTCQ